MSRESRIPAQATKVFAAAAAAVAGLESDGVRPPGVRRSAIAIALAETAETRRRARRRPLAPAEIPERAQTSRRIERKRFFPRAPPGGNRRKLAETLPARTLVGRARQIRLASLAIGWAGVHLPASASTRKFQSSRLKASGSSIFTVWPLLANTARPALGITRLR